MHPTAILSRLDDLLVDIRIEEAIKMVDDDLSRLWKANDLCQSDDAIFAASGVCDGYLPGVIIKENEIKTFAELIDVESGEVSRHDRTHHM